MAIPAGYEVQVRPRSGLALKHGITCLNTPGTIDSDYRGEVKIILANLGTEPFEALRGERIAQLVPAPVQRAKLDEADELDGTERGSQRLRINRAITGTMDFADDQLERYARHIVLKGNRRRRGSARSAKPRSPLSALVALGSPAIQYLAAAGIGRLRLIDDDIVALSNLQRQTLFKTEDIGAFKVERGRKTLSRRSIRTASFMPAAFASTPTMRKVSCAVPMP